jgi:hypothetical protein
MKKNIHFFTIIMSLTLCTLCTCFSGSSSSSNDKPVPGALTVSISPKEVTLPLSGHQIFDATVANSADESVTWHCDQGTIQQGMETSTGVYSAPVAPGDYEVEVTSNADASKKDKAIVHVISGTPPSTPGNPPYEGYYEGTITVDVTGTTGTSCSHTYDNHESFNIVLDFVSSFPSESGKEWKNFLTTSITGSIDETSTCMLDLDYLTGSETVTPSTFTVALILWNTGSYELAVGAVRYPNCSSNLGTMPGLINATDIHVSSTPNPPSNLSGEQTVSGPLGAGQYKVTWSLTLH